MLFSYLELRRQANLPEDVKLDDVINAINTIGFEVEGVKHMPKIEGVKFGKILKKYQNPNANRLNVLEIKFSDKKRTIQTTALNPRMGDIVLAFVPGSKIDGKAFDTKKIKGINSEGMLSSWNELGIEKEYIRDFFDQNVTLYNKGVTDLKTDPIEFLGLNDTIIDIDILSNRSDARSHIIMGRELSSFFNTKPLVLKPKMPNMRAKIRFNNGIASSLTGVEGKNDFTLSHYEIALLNKLQIKSISNIVDLTNLTLIMTGQPTRVYDKEKLGTLLTAKKVTDNIEIVGEKRISLKDNLAIVSGSKILSVGGVVTAQEFNINALTNDFLIELARFNIKDVRENVKTTKMSNLHSQQSSKISSLGTTQLAIDYLSTKLKTFSNSNNWKKVVQTKVVYSNNSAIKLAGFDLTKTPEWKKTILSLKNLGFNIFKDYVLVPPYRSDIESSQDIDEEIFRFYGYNNFKPVSPLVAKTKFKWVQHSRVKVASMGYQEVQTYTLISSELNDINPFEFKKDIKLQTFVSKKREVVCHSQARSILEIAEYNLKRKMVNFSIFSRGMISNESTSIIMASTIKSFEDIKQDIVNLLQGNISFVRHTSKDLHPGVSAKIMVGKKVVGWVGKVSPYKTKIDMWIGEIILPTSRFIKEIKPYSSEQMKFRDVTFKTKGHEEIGEKIKDIKYTNIEVIDVYKKDNVTKTTIRFTGDEKQIKAIDNKYN